MASTIAIIGIIVAAIAVLIAIIAIILIFTTGGKEGPTGPTGQGGQTGTAVIVANALGSVGNNQITQNFLAGQQITFTDSYDTTSGMLNIVFDASRNIFTTQNINGYFIIVGENTYAISPAVPLNFTGFATITQSINISNTDRAVSKQTIVINPGELEAVFTNISSSWQGNLAPGSNIRVTTTVIANFNGTIVHSIANNARVMINGYNVTLSGA